MRLLFSLITTKNEGPLGETISIGAALATDDFYDITEQFGTFVRPTESANFSAETLEMMGGLSNEEMTDRVKDWPPSEKAWKSFFSFMKRSFDRHGESVEEAQIPTMALYPCHFDELCNESFSFNPEFRFRRLPSAECIAATYIQAAIASGQGHRFAKGAIEEFEDPEAYHLPRKRLLQFMQVKPHNIVDGTAQACALSRFSRSYFTNFAKAIYGTS